MITGNIFLDIVIYGLAVYGVFMMTKHIMTLLRGKK